MSLRLEVLPFAFVMAAACGSTTTSPNCPSSASQVHCNAGAELCVYDPSLRSEPAKCQSVDPACAGTVTCACVSQHSSEVSTSRCPNGQAFVCTEDAAGLISMVCAEG